MKEEEIDRIANDLADRVLRHRSTSDECDEATRLMESGAVAIQQLKNDVFRLEDDLDQSKKIHDGSLAPKDYRFLAVRSDQEPVVAWWSEGRDEWVCHGNRPVEFVFWMHLPPGVDLHNMKA